MDAVETTPPDTVDPEVDPPRRRAVFAIAGAAVLALLGAWVYILFFYDPGLLIDELADRTFPLAAEQECAAAVARLEELPRAHEVDTPAERADVVEQSNVILTDMVDELERRIPAEQSVARKAVTEWLGDWRIYIADREHYVSNLRSDPEARFLESPKGSSNRGITRAIDSFAQVNRMNSCSTPGDVS